MSMVVKGGEDLAKFLRDLPEDLRRKAMRRAIGRAANVIRDEARLLAPKRTGKMAKSIKTVTRTKGTMVKATIRLRGKHSYLGLWAEYGTSPHYIGKAGGLSGRQLTKRAKADGTLGQTKMQINGQFVTLVYHPGARPRPFMRPALASKASEAVQTFGDYIRDYIQFGTLSAPGIEVQEAA